MADCWVLAVMVFSVYVVSNSATEGHVLGARYDGEEPALRDGQCQQFPQCGAGLGE